MNKTVLITGSSRGIGRAAALLFAGNGFRVVLNCRKSKDELMSLEKKLDAFGADYCSFIKDVTQFESVRSVFDELSSKAMLPDIIINKAGISHIGLVQDLGIEEWHRIIDTNLTSAFNVCKCAIPYFLQKGGGKIINVSSMWGVVGASCEAAYSASKGGLNAFTKALAKELAPSNISVNAVAFGVVDTQMNDFLDENERRNLIAEIPAGRMCTPEEAAHIIYNVAQMDNYVTGQIITADGGLT